jgi:GT2 family glycosyltransferase
MYYEDVDLCLRLRRRGRGIGIVPGARVEHDYTFAKGDYKWFLLERNRLWTVLSVYPAPLLLAIAPALLALELVLIAVAARDGWLRAKLRAQAAVLRSLPRLRRRRGTVGSAPIAGMLSSRLDSPYLRVPAPARRLQAAYWAGVRRAMR